MEEALVLTKFATSVTIVHRRDEFRASKIMQDRAHKNPKMKFMLNTEVIEILGKDKVEGVKLKSQVADGASQVVVSNFGGHELNATSQELAWEMPIDGVFVAIGHIPNTTVFKGVELDKQGFIIVHSHTKTNIEGVFVAGDVHDSHYKQAVTAAGFGCMAALEVEKWISNRET
jgi:thioredoxin reductase (NADPH)